MTKHIFYTKILTFTFFFISYFGYSQAPEGINYQAVLRKSNGQLWSNYELISIVEIVQGNISGPPVYREKHTSVTNGQGIVNYVIGGGVPNFGSFESIDWNVGPYYLKLNIDFMNGEGLQLYGIQQLLSVPYALHAKVADSIAGGGSGQQGPIGPPGADGQDGAPDYLEQMDKMEQTDNPDLTDNLEQTDNLD